MPENRAKTGQFAPGQSGNPGGRPKLTDAQKDTLAALKGLAQEVPGILRGLLKSKDTPPQQKIKICELLLDRAYGKVGVSEESGFDVDAWNQHMLTFADMLMHPAPSRRIEDLLDGETDYDA